MIGSFGPGTSAGTAIGAARTLVSTGNAANASHRKRHAAYMTEAERYDDQWECVHESTAYSQKSPYPIGLSIIVGVLLAAFAILILTFYGGDSFEPHLGKINPEAIERVRQRELASHPPPPTYLYSQKVPTKILHVGSYKHISARVRNQATGTVDSVYLCKKYCGLRYEGTQSGNLVDITWHSYRDQQGIYQRVDAGELKSLYR